MIIDNIEIGLNLPTYFIADISANHDGDLDKAKELIFLAKEKGANAAKFQHFSADTIVSDFGFKTLDTQLSHQSKWNKSVYEVYKKASLNIEWTHILSETCKKIGITFFTSPYSFELVDYVDQYVPVYKIGSGDITWHELIEYIAKKSKPVFIATGASTLDEVIKAIEIISIYNKDFVIMQCNTNYTASLDNFKHINLNVLKKYRELFPENILGLSDHTPGHTTVLGAVALGARVIEKHFTLDNNCEGPDHEFSMTPNTWREMVLRTRELEYSLGNKIKKIEDNEYETSIVQRRSIRLKRKLLSGELISKEDLIFLRPCPKDALPPFYAKKIIGKRINCDIKEGDYIKLSQIQ